MRIGDLVICKRPTENFRHDRYDQVATILGFKSKCRQNDRLVLSEPFETESMYDIAAFDLYNPSLENK